MTPIQNIHTYSCFKWLMMILTISDHLNIKSWWLTKIYVWITRKYVVKNDITWRVASIEAISSVMISHRCKPVTLLYFGICIEKQVQVILCHANFSHSCTWSLTNNLSTPLHIIECPIPSLSSIIKSHYWKLLVFSC